jgi:hypothetical protein
MRDCPECNSPCDGSTCRSCGWTEHGTTASRPIDPLRYLCHHETRGLRCGNTGTFSPNTIGDPKGKSHPGPWFCWQHAVHVHGGNASGGPRKDATALDGLTRARQAIPRPRRLDAEEIAERLAMQVEGIA